MFYAIYNGCFYRPFAVSVESARRHASQRFDWPIDDIIILINPSKETIKKLHAELTRY